MQGRGEFVRLALEAARADYVDVARVEGVKAMMAVLNDASLPHPPFAPPFLQSGAQTIAQAANILQYLGPRLDLAPGGEPGRLFVHQLQLTIADLVAEAHDTHHPVDMMLYYDDQKPEAKRRAQGFREQRIPKYLGYFERVLDTQSGAAWLAGRTRSYVDLSLFQVIEGLRYAFPRAMKTIELKLPKVVALHDRVAALPAIAVYLASERRIAFNEDGIFRRYPELDS